MLAKYQLICIESCFGSYRDLQNINVGLKIDANHSLKNVQL